MNDILDMWYFVNTTTGELLATSGSMPPLRGMWKSITPEEFLLYAKIALFAVEKFRKGE